MTRNAAAFGCFSTVLSSLIYHFYLRPNEKSARIINFIRYSVLLYALLYTLSFINLEEYSRLTDDDSNNTIWSLARISFFTLWIGI